jgi:hypothetical protein
MTTLFIDYRQRVMQEYDRKKESNILPYGLMHLTPANLKDECAKRCTKDVNRRDEKVIRDFCGDLNESRNCHAIIQRCDTDRFRPLVNFLKQKSVSTDEKNIELLAWLIDFPGRPWEVWKKHSDEHPVLTEPEQATGDKVTASVHRDSTPATAGGKPTGDPINPGNVPIVVRDDGSNGNESTGEKIAETGNKGRLEGKNTKRLAAVFMLSLIIGAGGIWWLIGGNQSGGCMYWHEDHYESIACNQKVPDARIIALDTMKLKNFRKLTRPDTITYLAIGKVWYSKIDGKIEYYTSAGEHPLVFDHRLKPISKYIIDKYILSGTVAK